MASTRKPIFFGWWVVATSMVAMSAGTGPFAMASFGVLMLSFQQEFGWDRASLSWSLTLLNAATALSLILVGRLVDRHGARAVLLPSMALMSICLAAVPMVREIWHLWLLFLIMGSVGAATNSVTHVPVLAAWFNRRRGVALGIAMSGIGIGYSYVPVLVQRITAEYGWRTAYYCLAALLLFVALPLVYKFLVEKPSDRGERQDGLSEPPPAAYGKDVAGALRTREFWILTLIFSLLTTVMYGLFTHLVPMLSDTGVSTARAAAVASVMGLATFAGRFLIGFVVDEIFGPIVLAAMVILAGFGVVLLDAGVEGPALFGAAVLLGLTIGAEADLLAYLASRYFGTRALGSIFGLQVAAYMGGVALGPAVFGVGQSAFGSYDPVLKACLVGLAVILALALLLRRYPDWTEGGETMAPSSQPL